MLRLIWAYAGHTYHIVGNLMSGLISYIFLYIWILIYFRTEICCGIIFKGLNGEILVDQQLLRPCCCRPQKQTRQTELRRSTSLEDTDSNSSTPSFAGINFYNSNPVQTETPPDSPPESPEKFETSVTEEEAASLALTTLQCSSQKLDYAPPITLTMECWGLVFHSVL